MVGIDGGMMIRGDVVKPIGLEVVEKQLYLTMQRRMVVLEGQDIIGALLDDSPGNFFLTPHRIGRHRWRFPTLTSSAAWESR